MTLLNEIHTIKAQGLTSIKIAKGLNEFPKELFELKDTLEILDLSGNNLSELPENFYDFSKLRIVFFANNKFKVFPKVLAKCPSLTMIGFKSNRINFIPENSFPKKLQWLILTDNEIENLPDSIGECIYLQKAAFAGNRIKLLPDSMHNCKNLELLRISANSLIEYPKWLFEMPRLSWLAIAGNPCAPILNKPEINRIPSDNIDFEHVLGEGASGVISKARMNGELDVAVKVFKGDVTSDGYPQDEMNTCIKAGNHSNLVPLIGELVDPTKLGLVMGLIPDNFKVLGKPPSFETCTRDVLDSTNPFDIEIGLKILICIASALEHLHQNGIMHGDLYTHNILFDLDGNAYLGDFGAATYYDKTNFQLCEKIDIRAFGCLIEDVLELSKINIENSVYQKLNEFKEQCFYSRVKDRPTFNSIKNYLLSL
jgi:tRNA A-37 threonylcarbamoyl transferase component Bud32